MATPSDVPPTPVHDELNPPPPTDDDAEFFKNDPGF
jgi:hypothetical protein